jgi:hypothetical protein
VNFTSDVNGISQRLSLVAPSSLGDYELLCEALEFDVGQNSIPANFTIRVIEEPSTVIFFITSVTIRLSCIEEKC